MTDIDVASLPVLPANSYIPMFHTTLGDDAVDLAAVCGLYLDDWQAEIVKGLCSFDEEGRMAARQACILIPRQQGKNICLEARELAGLVLLQEKIMLHTAHEFRTAQSSYNRVKEHLDRGAAVIPHYDKFGFRNSGAETSIRIPEIKDKKTGKVKRKASYLQFTPRTPGAGRGLTVEFLVVDEAYAYTTQQASALDFTQNQSQNPQKILTSSTGFPESIELLATRELGLQRALSNMLFVESKADDGSDPGDREQWYKALPGLRTGRQRIEEIEAHYAKAKALGDFTDFNREVLGLWASVDVASTIPLSLWRDLTYPPEADWEAPAEYAFAVDVSPSTTESGQVRASIYAVGRDELGFYHTWNVGADDDILWVAEFLKIQQEQRTPRVTVLDPMSPAGALIPMFDDLGVKYKAMSSGQCMSACSQFLAIVKDGKLRHGDDSLLEDAVSNGIQRWIGQKGAWLWARKNTDADITPLVASTYATFALTGVEPDEEAGGWFW